MIVTLSGPCGGLCASQPVAVHRAALDPGAQWAELLALQPGPAEEPSALWLNVSKLSGHLENG